MQQFSIILIRFYRRTFSYLMGARCRFYPSCSYYAEQAIMKHGFIKGGWLAIKRICRCHPLNDGGYDPVPEQLDKKQCLGVEKNTFLSNRD